MIQAARVFKNSMDEKPSVQDIDWAKIKKESLLCESGCRELVSEVLKMKDLGTKSLLATGFFEMLETREVPVIIGVTNTVLVMVRESTSSNANVCKFEVWWLHGTIFRLGCRHNKMMNLRNNDGPDLEFRIASGMPDDTWDLWSNKINCKLPCQTAPQESQSALHGKFRLVCENQNPFNEIQRLSELKDRLLREDKSGEVERLEESKSAESLRMKRLSGVSKDRTSLSARESPRDSVPSIKEEEKVARDKFEDQGYLFVRSISPARGSFQAAPSEEAGPSRRIAEDDAVRKVHTEVQESPFPKKEARDSFQKVPSKDERLPEHKPEIDEIGTPKPEVRDSITTKPSSKPRNPSSEEAIPSISAEFSAFKTRDESFADDSGKRYSWTSRYSAELDMPWKEISPETYEIEDESSLMAKEEKRDIGISRSSALQKRPSDAPSAKETKDDILGKRPEKEKVEPEVFETKTSKMKARPEKRDDQVSRRSTVKDLLLKTKGSREPETTEEIPSKSESIEQYETEDDLFKEDSGKRISLLSRRSTVQDISLSTWGYEAEEILEKDQEKRESLKSTLSVEEDMLSRRRRISLDSEETAVEEPFETVPEKLDSRKSRRSSIAHDVLLIRKAPERTKDSRAEKRYGGRDRRISRKRTVVDEPSKGMDFKEYESPEEERTVPEREQIGTPSDAAESMSSSEKSPPRYEIEKEAPRVVSEKPVSRTPKVSAPLAPSVATVSRRPASEDRAIKMDKDEKAEPPQQPEPAKVTESRAEDLREKKAPKVSAKGIIEGPRAADFLKTWRKGKTPVKLKGRNLAFDDLKKGKDVSEEEEPSSRTDQSEEAGKTEDVSKEQEEIKGWKSGWKRRVRCMLDVRDRYLTLKEKKKPKKPPTKKEALDSELGSACDVCPSDIQLWMMENDDYKSQFRQKVCSPSPRRRKGRLHRIDPDISALNEDDPFSLNKFDRRVTRYMMKSKGSNKVLEMIAAERTKEQTGPEPKYHFQWTYTEMLTDAQKAERYKQQESERQKILELPSSEPKEEEQEPQQVTPEQILDELAPSDMYFHDDIMNMAKKVGRNRRQTIIEENIT